MSEDRASQHFLDKLNILNGLSCVQKKERKGIGDGGGSAVSAFPRISREQQ